MNESNPSSPPAPSSEAARSRLTAAEDTVQSAKQDWKLAKRKRKEAKKLARTAKKRLRRAKEELTEARRTVSQTEDKSRRIGAGSKKKRRKTPRIAVVKTGTQKSGAPESVTPDADSSRELQLPAPTGEQTPGTESTKQTVPRESDSASDY